MEGIWLVSHLILWVVVLALAWLTLSLLRLIGQLHQRLGPAGAAMLGSGPEIGERLPDLMAAHKVVDQALLGFPKKRDLLLVFVSPSCPACEELVKSLIPFSRREKSDLEVIMVSGSNKPEPNNRFSAMVQKSDIVFMVSPPLTDAARVGATPYGLWLDREGAVHAKGIVNHIEHLDSLQAARTSGIATFEGHLDKHHDHGDEHHDHGDEHHDHEHQGAGDEHHGAGDDD